jgi:hypothetical protein
VRRTKNISKIAKPAHGASGAQTPGKRALRQQPQARLIKTQRTHALRRWLSPDTRPMAAPRSVRLPNHLFALIAVPLMTATDFAGPPICEGPVPWCARPVPLIALLRTVGTVILGVALACVIRFVPRTPTAFAVVSGATARAAGGVRMTGGGGAPAGPLK